MTEIVFQKMAQIVLKKIVSGTYGTQHRNKKIKR